MENESRIEQAQELMDAFAIRTGLLGNEENASRRYLWTDAFAVQAFFGLLRTLGDEKYRQQAIRLIDFVHEHLGKFHLQDSRTGWISGMDEQAGKELPERQKDQSYNSRLEWERDGQYFHYLSRWMIALLQAHLETGNKKYLSNARDLFLSTQKFIYESGTGLAMYWKMDTQLSRPLVPSMGAHDPLEGLLCGLSLKNAIFEEDKKVEALIGKFEIMCRGKTWNTTDPLGIGGLLLNAVRAAQLEIEGVDLPSSVRSTKLMRESIASLKSLHDFGKDKNPNRRLAFRECGLSLGLRIAKHSKNAFFDTSFSEDLKEFFDLAPEIEDFWLMREHQKATTWQEHLDINAVSLAASVIASEAPEAFSAK
jgi:DUF2075 family protein